MHSSPQLFVVTFEHAQRAFKCARIEWGVNSDDHTRAQWIVTLAGRPVWSFDATDADTRDSVRAAVTSWWNESAATSAAPVGAPPAAARSAAAERPE